MSKRAEEVATLIRSEWHYKLMELENLLAKLPEFQEPKWIKCAEQMPELGQAIYCWREHHGTPSAIVYSLHEGLHSKGYWMPRFVPDPPETESELVMELKAIFGSDIKASSLASQMIACVKRHEAKKP